MAIKVREIIRDPEIRYSVTDASQATGISENSIYGYFSNRGVTTRGGLTLDQIAEACLAKKRGSGIDWDKVHEIERRLDQEKGILVIRENERPEAQAATWIEDQIRMEEV